jgi:hypothetical protein
LFSPGASTASLLPVTTMHLTLPALELSCPFTLMIKPRCKTISAAPDRWMCDEAAFFLDDVQMVDLDGVRAGLLASMYYSAVD